MLRTSDPDHNGSYLEFGSLSKMAVEGDLYISETLEPEIKETPYILNLNVPNSLPC